MVPLQFFKVVDISLQFTYSEIHTITTPSFTDPYHSLRLSIVWVRCQAYMYPPSFRMDDFYPCPQPRRPILCRPLFPVLLATSQRRPASREGSGEWPALAFHPTSPCPPQRAPRRRAAEEQGQAPNRCRRSSSLRHSCDSGEQNWAPGTATLSGSLALSPAQRHPHHPSPPAGHPPPPCSRTRSTRLPTSCLRTTPHTSATVIHHWRRTCLILRFHQYVDSVVLAPALGGTTRRDTKAIQVATRRSRERHRGWRSSASKQQRRVTEAERAAAQSSGGAAP